MITKHDKRRAWNEYYKKRTVKTGSPIALAGFNEVKEMTYVPNTTERSFARNTSGFLVKKTLLNLKNRRYLSGDDNSDSSSSATISSSAIMKLAMVGVISAITTEVIRRAIWKK